ncbi:hypothetical protein RB595_008198 [Gaeumannomyces hyphopodioides]
MAELALAVIPLVFEGVKLSKALRGKLSILRSYMDTVEEAQTLFQVQTIAFHHECKLVLRAAAEGNRGVDVAHLLEDVDHGDWTSPELEDCLQSYLGNSREPFKMLLRLICKKITKLDKDLSEYDERDEDGREGGSMANRMRNRVRVPFDEGMYEKEIEKLRRLVSNLRGLRERVAADKIRQTPQRPTSMPAEYRYRKQDAALWLRAMSETWNCSSAEHASHRAKLLLAHEPRGDRACLDVVINRTASASRTMVLDDRTGISFASHQLCVKPREVAAETGLLSPEPSVDDPRRGSHDDHDGKRRRVGARSDEPSDSRLTAVDQDAALVLSLAEVGDVCRHLSDHPASYCFSAERMSLGYVESRTRGFDLFPGHCPKGQPKPHLNGRLVPLQEIFRKDIDESVRDPQRFWLAGLVVKSALMHHNTAWWPDDWTLDQLCFYERPSDELADSLKTLHLTVDLPRREGTRDQQQQQKQSPDQSYTFSQAASPPQVDVVRQAMTEYGIRNLTLWCVGVALLQIGLWRPIRWDSHVEVRESLPRLERLNRQYWELTDRLVNCDFGRGARLQSPALQDEVYRSVVCELDAIMDEFRRAGI